MSAYQAERGWSHHRLPGRRRTHSDSANTKAYSHSDSGLIELRHSVRELAKAAPNARKLDVEAAYPWYNRRRDDEYSTHSLASDCRRSTLFDVLPVEFTDICRRLDWRFQELMVPLPTHTASTPTWEGIFGEPLSSSPQSISTVVASDYFSRTPVSRPLEFTYDDDDDEDDDDDDDESCGTADLSSPIESFISQLTPESSIDSIFTSSRSSSGTSSAATSLPSTPSTGSFVFDEASADGDESLTYRDWVLNQCAKTPRKERRVPKEREREKETVVAPERAKWRGDQIALEDSPLCGRRPVSVSPVKPNSADVSRRGADSLPGDNGWRLSSYASPSLDMPSFLMQPRCVVLNPKIFRSPPIPTPRTKTQPIELKSITRSSHRRATSIPPSASSPTCTFPVPPPNPAWQTRLIPSPRPPPRVPPSSSPFSSSPPAPGSPQEFIPPRLRILTDTTYLHRLATRNATRLTYPSGYPHQRGRSEYATYKKHGARAYAVRRQQYEEEKIQRKILAPPVLKVNYYGQGKACYTELDEGKVLGVCWEGRERSGLHS